MFSFVGAITVPFSGLHNAHDKQLSDVRVHILHICHLHLLQ